MKQRIRAQVLFSYTYFLIAIVGFFALLTPSTVWANKEMNSAVSPDAVEKFGMHILSTDELSEAQAFLSTEQPDSWHYLTIPFTLEDLEKQEKWQQFFIAAREDKIIPIVRLATRVEAGTWVVPTRKNIVDQLDFLAQLSWPTDKKYIIIYNEVNHAKEWGNTINPEEYARTLAFGSQWARSKNVGFVVLPAAMDLAAGSTRITKEAFAYLDSMVAYDPEIFSYVDIWNSHSYPNPGFSASPQRTGKNSLRGFEYELTYLKKHTSKELSVFITETGWEDSALTRRWLSSYYTYALQHIWSDTRVLAVTPFVYKGAPGPFAGFSFISASGKPTTQYYAVLQALKSQKMHQLSKLQ